MKPNDAREESIKLQELEDALERAKNKKVRVYKKGVLVFNTQTETK